MTFENIKGHPGAKVVIGILASRERVGYLLNSEPEKLGFVLKNAVKNAIAPIVVGKEKAKCQEVVHLAGDKDFDIRKLIPAPTNTPEDAGPYVTLGMCYASDVETGESDVTIHRLCLQSKDEMSMWITPGARHLGSFREKAEALGKPLPISISIGVDPAIEIASCFEPPTTPLGFNELSIAGAIRGKAVELAPCLTIKENCIANAEYVIEGELVPDQRIREDINTNTGKAMPEFPGYTGPACADLPVIKVKAVTHRINPVMQTCIGPSEEHVSMAGIPTEASILDMVERAMPGRVQNVYAHSSGGGKFLAVIQFKKSVPSDEGRQRHAALLAFSAFPELKQVVLVDEDVDIFDTNDVLWAMTTRMQADVDVITIPGVRCHPLDPSNDPACSWTIRDHGIACKTIYDATVPYSQKSKFGRAKFMEVDVKKFLPDFGK
jgi:4-hydroxy-3-polyprenylbenzoate decarboxylase